MCAYHHAHARWGVVHIIHMPGRQGMLQLCHGRAAVAMLPAAAVQCAGRQGMHAFKQAGTCMRLGAHAHIAVDAWSPAHRKLSPMHSLVAASLGSNWHVRCVCSYCISAPERVMRLIEMQGERCRSSAAPLQCATAHRFAVIARICAGKESRVLGHAASIWRLPRDLGRHQDRL